MFVKRVGLRGHSIVEVTGMIGQRLESIGQRFVFKIGGHSVKRQQKKKRETKEKRKEKKEREKKKENRQEIKIVFKKGLIRSEILKNWLWIIHKEGRVIGWHQNTEKVNGCEGVEKRGSI